MFKITKTLSIFLLAITMIACSKKSESGNSLEDKRKALESLKAEKTEIDKKISSLEKEITSMSGGKNQSIVEVEALEIKKVEFTRFVDMQGSVISDKTVQLSCKTAGQVVSINAQAGQQVAKGALLLQIDDEPYRKGLEEIETQYEFAKTVFMKQKRLWEQKAGSEIQYLQAKNNVEALEKRIASLKNQIDNAKIYAPFAGFIDEVVPKLGETVAPGYPVFKLTAMSDVKISVDVSEAYISTIKEGDAATIKFPELNEEINAKVSVATKSINPVSRSFKIEIKLPKLPKNLRPNMACGVSINDVKKGASIVIPMTSIQRLDGKEFVYVAQDENGIKAKIRYIKTGLSNQDKIEVLEGLNVGEKVLTKGSLDVADGQAINVLKVE